MVRKNTLSKCTIMLLKTKKHFEGVDSSEHSVLGTRWSLPLWACMVRLSVLKQWRNKLKKSLLSTSVHSRGHLKGSTLPTPAVHTGLSGTGIEAERTTPPPGVPPCPFAVILYLRFQKPLASCLFETEILRYWFSSKLLENGQGVVKWIHTECFIPTVGLFILY